MLLKEFKNKMLDIKCDTSEYYTCNLICYHLDPTFLEKYEDIFRTYVPYAYISTYECFALDGGEVGPQRANMLLLFEQYMISEKLYKDL